MLAVKSYDNREVEACRARIGAMLAAWRAIPPSEASAAFEPHCFNQMAIALDGSFQHRMRGHEGKDGNPLNEVRMLAASLSGAGAGRLAADATIKYEPAKSVLGLKFGDTIALSADDFEKLAIAFLDEIMRRYP